MFAVLLRSPWWYSALIGLFILSLSLVVGSVQVAILVASLAVPFFGIAAYAFYKQSQRPSLKRVIAADEQARELSAEQIATKIADEYTKVRFKTEKFKGDAAELELERGNRKLLVSSKRFKAANTGVGPLKNLVAAGKNAEATGYLYVTLGEISAAAHEYASEHNIEFIQANKLATFFDGRVKIV